MRIFLAILDYTNHELFFKILLWNRYILIKPIINHLLKLSCEINSDNYLSPTKQFK